MQFIYKLAAVGVVVVAATIWAGAKFGESERRAPVAPIAIPDPVKAPKPDPAKVFAETRESMMQTMRTALATKDYYSALGFKNEFQAVADPEFMKLWQQVFDADDKATKARLAKQDAIDKKEAKRRGVSLGMTREQVVGSSWGKPQQVNTTTGRYGTREQWVYSSRNYLYFEDGILTSIQN